MFLKLEKEEKHLDVRMKKKKEDKSWAAYLCSKCESTNVDPIEKYCYNCGCKRLKKNG